MTALTFNDQQVVPFLETENLWLIPVSELHCTEQYLAWLHDEEVTFGMASGVFPQSLDDLKSFVADSVLRHALFFAIHLKEDMKHIGNLKVDNINTLHSYADYGIMMGDKDEWGKGYAKEASMALFHHCFTRVNIRKIVLGVVNSNERAVGLYERMGFIVEGVLRKQYFVAGQYVDSTLMALFQEDYLKEHVF